MTRETDTARWNRDVVYVVARTNQLGEPESMRRRELSSGARDNMDVVMVSRTNQLGDPRELLGYFRRDNSQPFKIWLGKTRDNSARGSPRA